MLLSGEHSFDILSYNTTKANIAQSFTVFIFFNCLHVKVRRKWDRSRVVLFESLVDFKLFHIQFYRFTSFDNDSETRVKKKTKQNTHKNCRKEKNINISF